MEEALNFASANCKVSLFSIYDLAFERNINVRGAERGYVSIAWKPSLSADAERKTAPVGRSFGSGSQSQTLLLLLLKVYNK